MTKLMTEVLKSTILNDLSECPNYLQQVGIIEVDSISIDDNNFCILQITYSTDNGTQYRIVSNKVVEFGRVHLSDQVVEDIDMAIEIYQRLARQFSEE